jgi:hypothetical protein
MRKFSAALVLAVFAIGVTSAQALDRRVQIVNESSYTMREFYASNTGSKSWEEDILGREVLPSGGTVTINIDDGSGYCKYDFKAVFENDAEATSTDNNVCELSVFRFTD